MPASPSSSSQSAVPAHGSRRRLWGLLLLLVCAGVLWQVPARDALMLRGLDHALAPLVSDEGVAYLRAVGGQGAPIHIRVSLDGRPYESAAVQRVVRSKLAR